MLILHYYFLHVSDCYLFLVAVLEMFQLLCSPAVRQPVQCVENNNNNISSQKYWLILCCLKFLNFLFRNVVLRLPESDGIGNLGPVSLKNILFLLFTWFIIYFCLRKGVKSSGKVIPDLIPNKTCFESQMWLSLFRMTRLRIIYGI